MQIPMVAIVGRSNSGKTTVIEKLVPLLAEAGVRVAVVKHAPIHGVQTDVAGTDTFRFWEAGARHVTLVARDRIAQVHRYGDGAADLTAALRDIHDVDLVILEGFKASPVPKIEVIREARDPDPIDGLEGRIAVVSDVAGLELGCPRFGFAGLSDLAAFIAGRFVSES